MAEQMPGDRRDGEDIGRVTEAVGISVQEEPAAQDLRAAAADNGGENQSKARPGEEPPGETEVSGSSQTEPAGFYKSQEEVDRAFGRRLASERRRWEREHQEALRQTRAETREQGRDDADIWLPQQQMYAREYAYFADLVAQANALAKECPEFDLMDELRQNPAFEEMVTNGVPVARAYEAVGQAPLTQKERSIRQDERRRVVEEMESRSQILPTVDRDPGLSGPALDVTRLSEEELTRLAERVRKGERVVL